MKMKIGFDAKRMFNNRTGLGNYSRRLLDYLLLYYPENEYHLFTPKIGIEAYYEKYTALENVTIHTAKGKNGALWRTFGITKIINRLDLDAYHGLSHELPRNISKSKCFKVVTIHDLIYKIHPKYFPFMDRLFYHLKCTHSIRSANKIIAISKNTKQEILSHFSTSASKINVIYNTIDPEIYTSNLTSIEINTSRSFKEYALSVGSIEPRKNYETLITALKYLPKKDRLPIYIIGNGKPNYIKVLKNLILKHKLADWISIKTGITDTELRSLYQDAKMLLFPSTYEGHGLPVTEALLYGIPVISSQTSSMKEAGGPDTLYFNPSNPRELADSILSLNMNNALRLQMKENGLRYALETFDPKKITDQLMDLYNVGIGKGSIF